MANLNLHIENYLSYYLNSKFIPEFAVLLQGKWGCGKTWFINQFIEKFSTPAEQKRVIYITLHGVSVVSEIEDQIFQQLHPVLSSKTMALTGKILKGLARASLKIDFDGDGKSDASISPRLPEINLPDYLKNTSECILVVDDLERCIIPIENILGYLNSFVEHQRLKIIILANEEELQRIKGHEEGGLSYRKIKEKLIGKTFRVKPDIESAYVSFVSQVEQKQISKFLTDYKEKVIEIFNTANYCNLRHLKQSLWDFERFYGNIPNHYTSNSDLMLDLLSFFFAFSFEIKSGKIIADDIKGFTLAIISEMVLKDSKVENQVPESCLVLKKYNFLTSADMILTETSWCNLFDKGYLPETDLMESLEKSKYYQNENTATWVKLWHYLDLEDDKFTILYKEVLKEWEQKKFQKPGEILHVCGLFLKFSKDGLIEKNIDNTFVECKSYINNLKDNREFENHKKGLGLGVFGRDAWGGLGYTGKELKEFGKIYDYLEQKINDSKIETLPEAGKELLNMLSQDDQEFERRMYFNNNEDNSFYELPIFKYIAPEEFFKIFLTIPNRKKRTVINAIKERYKYPDHPSKLSEEIEFLKKLNILISRDTNERKNSVSKFILNEIVSPHLSKIISTIESRTKT